MENIDRLKQHIRNGAVNSFPKQFLVDLQNRTERAYQDTFAEVAHSKTTLPEQRIHKLRQERCFRMDYELAQAAKKFDIPYTAKQLAENDWQFTYITSGNFGATQSYVPQMGCLPSPAKFRDTLARAATIPRLPIDDDEEIFRERTFYGLFAHNPIGSIFDEEKQKLGSIQLCVPFEDMKKYALEVSVAELLADYPAESKPGVAFPSPTWKRDTKRKDTGTE